MNGKERQERGDLRGTHLGWVALAVEKDEPLDPMDVHLIGASAVVAGADGLADPVEKSWLWCAGRTGFTDGERRREGTCGQDGIGDLAVRPNGDSHAHNAPFIRAPEHSRASRSPQGVSDG